MNTAAPPPPPPPPPPGAPAWIALSGLVPLFALAAGIGFASDALALRLIDAMIGYAAVVLGFTGGVRWGAELVRGGDRPDLMRLAAAGLMTVPAWAALLLAERPLIAIAILAVCGFVQLNWDLSAARVGLLPAWTWRLRIVLTVLGAACLAIAALRLI